MRPAFQNHFIHDSFFHAPKPLDSRICTNRLQCLPAPVAEQRRRFPAHVVFTITSAMAIDPLESVSTDESDNDSVFSKFRKLNQCVAITVALLATFMGICKVKDDNIVQSMQQAQANKLDHWNFYQARNIREEVAKGTLVQLQLAALSQPASSQADYQQAIATYTQLAADQALKKNELKDLAAQDQKDYDAANFRDDQFDLADALLAIAISLLAVTALTHLWWLYAVALVPTVFGVLMGLSGLAGWAIHPDALIKLLS